MRIISGKYRGRQLSFSKKKECRPTQDRVKETLFNMLTTDLTDVTCCDLFAGTGSLGLEALSRGAGFVDFVEINAKYIQKNMMILNDADKQNIKIHHYSYNKFLKSCQKKYHIIFVDPPWTHLNYFDISLNHIFDFDILSNSGTVICEHPKDFEITHKGVINKQRVIGNTAITFINYD